MPVLQGLPLLLPAGANVNGAYQNPAPIRVGGANQNPTYKIAADSYELVTLAYCSIATDATVGARQGVFAVVDADGNIVLNIAAGVTQAPATTVQYTYGIGVATTTVAGALVQTIEIPATLLYPTWTVIFGLTIFGGPGDTISKGYLVTQRYPTGTPASQRSPTAPALV